MHLLASCIKNSNDLVPQQDVFTGPFGNTEGTPFDFNTEFHPQTSWTLCPGNFLYRVVVQDIMNDGLNGFKDAGGDCTVLDGIPKKEFDLGLGEYITDAFGRTGAVLDKGRVH